MIGNQIKKRRLELGLSQEELARRMGYKHKSSINKIEIGVNDIPQSKIEKFAAVLQTSVPFLMGWEQEERRRLYYEKIIDMFRKLDATDQARIEERMSAMLEDEKYEAP